MKQFSYYHKDTGVVHGRVVSLNIPDAEIEEVLRMNAPVDHVAIAGALNADIHEVNVLTKAVVPRSTQRAESAGIRRQRALAKIHAIEARQARRVRELLADGDPQLKAMDEEIRKLRSDLQE